MKNLDRFGRFLALLTLAGFAAGGLRWSPDCNGPQIDYVTRVLRETSKASLPAARIASSIVIESRRAGIDPLLVVSMMDVESSFNTHAVSRKGARGLLQVMPATARYVLDRKRLSTPVEPDLSNPLFNVRIGVWYLKHLHDLFNGDVESVLMAYNLGPSKLKRVLPEGGVPSSVEAYVQQVLNGRDSLARRYAAYRSVVRI